MARGKPVAVRCRREDDRHYELNPEHRGAETRGQLDVVQLGDGAGQPVAA